MAEDTFAGDLKEMLEVVTSRIEMISQASLEDDQYNELYQSLIGTQRGLWKSIKAQKNVTDTVLRSETAFRGEDAATE